MNVRQKLLGGFLTVAAMVTVTGAVVLRTDAETTHQAAVTEADQVARGIAKDVAFGPAGGAEEGLIDRPAALIAYLERLHDLQDRDIVVVDTRKMILADAVPQNIGLPFDHDTGNQVGRTIADGRSRVFVETSVDYPEGIQQVVVPVIGAGGVTEGAVILEYTPLLDQMEAVTGHAESIIVIAGVLCILLVLVLGVVTAESITRRIRRLTGAVESIRDGDYTSRVSLGRRDEISRLGNAFNDMAARLDASAREILAKEYTDSILANAGEGICGVDAEGRITFANEAAGRLTGLGAEGLLGREATSLLPDVERAEITVDRPDGTSVRVAYTVSAIEKDGRQIGGVVVLRDVSRQRALEHDLRHQALHDGLTDLPNRKLLLDRIDHAMTRARTGRGADIAVLYLDLDGFKKINDSLGHNAGDLLLRTAAERLTAALRPHDTVARLGGDEFAVLLEDPEDPERWAQACVDALSRPFLLQHREATVSVSVGVLPGAERYTDADEVLRNADVAMYAAKAAGRACYQVFETRMHEQLLDRLDQETRLREAVHRGELRLHLQPVVEIATRQLRGVEALVRWEDPEHGLQQPGAFIPLAEETGLITEIDRWMLTEACRAVQEWRESSPETAPKWVSVNLSAANLEVPDLTDRVAYSLSSTGLPPECLVLELTETVLMRDIAVTSERLDELRELGVRIAIDDFGTGYSSLGYLRDIPVDVLKVDRSFITGIVGNERQQELVSAVLQLGTTLGLKVVVEGVETEEQADLLVEMGDRFAQGYHLGRPEPVASLRARLAADSIAVT
ncbi:EAL domain-containing protein [Actinoplanes bogorensis]|uniref:EAL domain-containing protein n=1 Tax=Paractinoplanes bogorensis TaxID=1610840 RepID=A0ABS5YU35_9ACTN|nr:EAL domain-containing protein [Actinoplanes bogorensis]MBU2666841.1 EAL domain-containing protein [Actinoplanes bogorensis]